jgi:pyruvate,water dikinase
MKFRRTTSLCADRQPLDAREVGGKLARQQVMAQAGLPVPRFFCLPRQLFDEVLAPQREGLRRFLENVDFSDGRAVREAAAEAQRRVMALDVAPSLVREIEKTFDEHFPRDALVAVRASTVGTKLEESEDSADNPFAGISETFLFVPRDQVLEKIRGCWASGFNEEGLLYRQTQGMDLLGFGVAVAVQQMVPGRRSFVMFSANPKDATREVVIVAGYGIGEGVVQERVGVDHYFINGRTGEVSSTLGTKDRQLVFDQERGSGLIEQEVPAELRQTPCLRDSELRRLKQKAEEIEKLFGQPQDIEGTFTDDGELFFLQSRPIAFDYRRMIVWTNANVTESFPGATTALTYSFSRFFYRVIFADVYRRLGVEPKVLGDNYDQYLDRMIGFLENRVYYNLTSFYHLHRQSPLFPLLRGHWEKMMGFRTSYHTSDRGVLGAALSKLWGGVAFSAALSRGIYLYAQHDRCMKEFHAWWEERIAPLRGRTFQDDDPLLVIREFQQVWREVGTNWGVTLLNDSYLPVLYGVAEQLFEKWNLAEDASLLSDLLCGGEQLLSVEIILSAVALSEMVRADEGLRQRFTSESAESLWSALAAGELEETFAAAVHHHLHNYGDRGLQELKMEQPNLRHQPVALMRSLQGYLKTGVTVETMRRQEAQTRAAAEERLRVALAKAPLRRSALQLLLSRLRKLIRHRENSRYCRSELFGFSKNVFRALGQYLEKQGVLASADDVFHLAQDEVFGYFDGTGVTTNLGAIAAVRRDEYQARQELETPIELTTVGGVRDNQLTVVRQQTDGAQTLAGLGSSAGRVRGTARVITDPTKVEELDPESILVARETDPGWLFLMLAARGIVVERGSMLSHTAITGRKFGIPTVVGVADATLIIRDGEEIEIDGATGTVQRLSQSSPVEAVAVG